MPHHSNEEASMIEPNELAHESVSRQNFLTGGLAIAAAISLSTSGGGEERSRKFSRRAHDSQPQKGNRTMRTITTKDGTQIYYKDWGRGPVVTFSHGWPLNADAWDGQMHFLVQQGFRVIAHDRRGHGRSSQSSSGNDMNGYADDLAAVIETLDLRNATLVGHSTGGGEVVRYIGRHGTQRVSKAVLVAAVPPIMLKTAANPEGLAMEVFDGIRAGLPRIALNFTRTWLSSFMVPIGLERRSLKELSISSGCGACSAGSRMPMKASRHFLRPISPRI